LIGDQLLIQAEFSVDSIQRPSQRHTSVRSLGVRQSRNGLVVGRANGFVSINRELIALEISSSAKDLWSSDEAGERDPEVARTRWK